jgi:RNA polymerase sigma-54 factor
MMTPQLQQAIKLLALSNLEVEAFIGEALDANPLLEVGDGTPSVGASDGDSSLTESTDLRRTTLESSPVDQLIGEGRAADDRPLDIDTAALDRDRDTGDGAGTGPGESADWGGAFSMAGGEDGPGIDERGGGSETLAEHLGAQVGAATRDPLLAAIARHLIGQLDDSGYLTVPLLEVSATLDAPLAQVEAALVLVQSLDPTGIGARSLTECLALQAREADRYDPCMARLLENLDLLARGELPRLKRICGVDDEDLTEMLAELRGYDPKPGLQFGAESGEAITPDVLIGATPEGGFTVTLNQATLPRLIVNRSYYVEMRGACDDKAARGWLSDKLADASWLVKALDERDCEAAGRLLSPRRCAAETADAADCGRGGGTA